MHNIVVIPFHDWRKIIKEGFRTRDAHFIETLSNNKNNNIIVVNRPITLLEMLLKKKEREIKGTVIYKKGSISLYKVKENLFIIDYFSKDFLSQGVKKYAWYFQKYASKKYVDFINESLKIMKVDTVHLLSQNIFAYKLVLQIQATKKVFDAWDNFTKFDIYKPIQKEISNAYKSYKKSCDFWITNSADNSTFFEKIGKEKNIFLIKNGLDTKRFNNEQISIERPVDMVHLPKPIIGFGGKITHLLDVTLINKVIGLNKEKSFVFIGQILNQEIFDAITKAPNFYYLGDKHYDDYPRYVYNFDICIVPYTVDKKKQSGANTIKVYEFLATEKKVVGTRGNGLEDLEEFVYIANDAETFSNNLQTSITTKKIIDVNKISWNKKVTKLIELLA